MNGKRKKWGEAHEKDKNCKIFDKSPKICYHFCVIHYFLSFLCMNTTQKLAYSAFAAMAVAPSTFAAIQFDNNKVQSGLKGSEQQADSAIQTLITNFMIFLALIAVCYGLYGGFLMLTAGGDEDKVKKGRTILLQVALGLVVIFLANSIVQFILKSILGS